MHTISKEDAETLAARILASAGPGKLTDAIIVRACTDADVCPGWAILEGFHGTHSGRGMLSPERYACFLEAGRLLREANHAA
jgi:hypothetical protein